LVLCGEFPEIHLAPGKGDENMPKKKINPRSVETTLSNLFLPKWLLEGLPLSLEERLFIFISLSRSVKDIIPNQIHGSKRLAESIKRRKDFLGVILRV